jgi:hypothetical protein
MPLDSISPSIGSPVYQSLPAGASEKPTTSNTSTTVIDGQSNLAVEKRGGNVNGLDDPTSSMATMTAGLSGRMDSDMGMDLGAFMALFQKLAQTMRDSSRAQRTSELQGQVADLQAAGDKIKSAAEKRFSAAVTEAVVGMIGGAVSIGMGCVAGYRGIKAAKAQGTLELKQGQIKSMDAAGVSVPKAFRADVAQSGVSLGTAQARTMMVDAGIKGATTIMENAGKLASAGDNLAASKIDSEKMNDETNAKLHEANVDIARDQMQRMKEIIDDIKDKTQAINQSQIETNKSISRNV